MFRDGQYLEVIKASEGCLATAIVTIKEKTVEYKKKKITTNKWLDLQDWASLYGIIRKAIIRNNENRSQGKLETTERRKSTRHLEITYKFESSEFLDDRKSLPTIRVSVSASRKNSESSNRKKEKNDVEIKKCEKETNEDEKIVEKSCENDNFLCDNYSLEEYVPPKIASNKKVKEDFKYVPSRKSMLMRMRCSVDENKYTPTSGGKISLSTNNSQTEVCYIPNSISSLTKSVHETYDPCEISLSTKFSETYVPSSKSVKPTIEEYQPDFPTKTMKFDDSYVPSSTFTLNKEESRKRSRKSREATKKSSNRSISKIAKREL